MIFLLRGIIFAIALTGFTSAVFAQSQVPFGGLLHDSSLPVEISADQLSISQEDGTAIFRGNVVIGQGTMRLSAGQVLVEYQAGDTLTGEVSRMLASGGVLLTNGAEAAEAQEAVYTIGSGEILMTGGVILTQGENALGANRMVVFLGSGTAELSGRVHTILRTGNN